MIPIDRSTGSDILRLPLDIFDGILCLTISHRNVTSAFITGNGLLQLRRILIIMHHHTHGCGHTACSSMDNGIFSFPLKSQLWRMEIVRITLSPFRLHLRGDICLTPTPCRCLAMRYSRNRNTFNLRSIALQPVPHIDRQTVCIDMSIFTETKDICCTVITRYNHITATIIVKHIYRCICYRPYRTLRLQRQIDSRHRDLSTRRCLPCHESRCLLTGLFLSHLSCPGTNHNSQRHDSHQHPYLHFNKSLSFYFIPVDYAADDYQNHNSTNIQPPHNSKFLIKQTYFISFPLTVA